MTKLISIVVSAYNEETNINELYSQISLYLSKVSKIKYEIIFVNDGSTGSSVVPGIGATGVASFKFTVR